MEGFRYLPHVYFVAEHGLDHFDEAMTLQYELTKRFTAEFSIRAYLEHDPTRRSSACGVGCRPERPRPPAGVGGHATPLPWAPRLREFQRDPAPVSSCSNC